MDLPRQKVCRKSTLRESIIRIISSESEMESYDKTIDEMVDITDIVDSDIAVGDYVQVVEVIFVGTCESVIDKRYGDELELYNILQRKRTYIMESAGC